MLVRTNPLVGVGVDVSRTAPTRFMPKSAASSAYLRVCSRRPTLAWTTACCGAMLGTTGTTGTGWKLGIGSGILGGKIGVAGRGGLGMVIACVSVKEAIRRRSSDGSIIVENAYLEEQTGELPI